MWKLASCIPIIIFLFPASIKAQRNKEISLYYHYSAFYNANPFDLYSGDKYPKGFGLSMTSQFSKQFAWTTGLSYSNKKANVDKTLYGSPGSPTRIVTDSEISFVSLNLGIAYPITEKKLSARFQGKVVSIYYFGDAIRKTYINSDIIEDNDSVSEISLGLNLSFRFNYFFLSSAAIFIEPGASYFFFGRIREYQSYNINTGISYCF